MVRLATETDLPRVLEMARWFHKEAGIGQSFPGELDATRLTNLGRAGLEQGSLWIAEDDGTPVGFMLVLALEHPFTGAIGGEEIAWWVAPGWRNGRVGYYLLRACQEWARQNGLAYLRMVAPAGSSVGRFLQKQGFSAVEMGYVVKLTSTDGRL